MNEDGRYPVGEVARMSGVSVRALHHYDEIGLLCPSRDPSSGHRWYDDQDLLRLHRILVYRELGFELGAIAELLDDGRDPIAALREQQVSVREQVDRLQHVDEAVDRHLQLWELGYRLAPDEYRAVFGDYDPRPVAERVPAPDDPQRRAVQQQAWEQLSRDDWAAFMAESDRLYRRFTQLLADRVPPDDPQALALSEEHRLLAERFSGAFTYADQLQMADLLVVEPGRSNVDGYHAGLADFMHTAIVANAARTDRQDA